LNIFQILSDESKPASSLMNRRLAIFLFSSCDAQKRTKMKFCFPVAFPATVLHMAFDREKIKKRRRHLPHAEMFIFSCRIEIGAASPKVCQSFQLRVTGCSGSRPMSPS